MRVNSEAIYATRPREGTLWKEGDDVRFTLSKDNKTVYAICLKWPGKRLTLKTVRPEAGAAITMLGFEEPLRWRFDGAKGLVIDLPERLQDGKNRPCTACVGGEDSGVAVGLAVEAGGQSTD